MSGHEKFYIPHDDLLELKAAMESLEAAITTLEVSTRTLSAALPVPKGEIAVVSENTVAQTYEEILAVYEVLDADVDTFVRRVNVSVKGTDLNPIAGFDSNILIAVSPEDGEILLYDTVFGDDGATFKRTTLLATEYWYGKTWDLGDSRIPAGKNLAVLFECGGITVGTVINTTVTYIPLLE